MLSYFDTWSVQRRTEPNVQHSLNLKAYLPRADGTKDVFCVNSKRTRGCSEYATLNENGVLIKGIVIYHDTNTPRYLCSWKCAESYARHRRSVPRSHK